MHEEIHDFRMQRKLRHIMDANPSSIKIARSIRYCGSRVAHIHGATPAVFLLSNGEHSKFFGTATCKNAWACPVCSAKVMAKYANEIACALDALEQPKYNQVAFMITLTVPHTRTMSGYETTEILFNTWKDFTVHGNKTYEGAPKDPFAKFCQTFNCKHRVRVGEYTWGEHGWHPHFHCLFWVDRDKLQDVKAWEHDLKTRWLLLAKRNTIKIWDEKVSDDDPIKKANNRTRADIMYSKLNETSSAVYISVDKNGNVIRQKSSMYICGWGADRELTGNFRKEATNEGHLTPYQILEKATEQPGDFYAKLYLEYIAILRSKSRRRIMFSTNSGIKQIIKEWMLTNQYIETLKKKDITNPNTRMRIVAWFTESQWFKILCYEELTNKEIIVSLLHLAKQLDRTVIEDFLLELQIDIRENGEHELAPIVTSLFA